MLHALTSQSWRVSFHSFALMSEYSYCPWVWNDVGVNNHRQFLLFILFLVVSVILLIRLAFACKLVLPG